MGRYEAPAVLATYSLDELVEEAATCLPYKKPPEPSDRDLKEGIEELDGALDGVKSIRTS